MAAASPALASVAWCAVVVLAGCHLADDPEVRCPVGSHADTGRCVPDVADGPTITIAGAEGGTSCAGTGPNGGASARPPTVDPVTIHITTTGSFRFRNADTVEHEVRGADGQVWAKAGPGATSDFVGLTRVGLWRYAISGCPDVGTVVVE